MIHKPLNFSGVRIYNLKTYISHEAFYIILNLIQISFNKKFLRFLIYTLKDKLTILKRFKTKCKCIFLSPFLSTPNMRVTYYHINRVNFVLFAYTYLLLLGRLVAYLHEWTAAHEASVDKFG